MYSAHHHPWPEYVLDFRPGLLLSMGTADPHLMINSLLKLGCLVHRPLRRPLACRLAGPHDAHAGTHSGRLPIRPLAAPLPPSKCTLLPSLMQCTPIPYPLKWAHEMVPRCFPACDKSLIPLMSLSLDRMNF